MYAQKKNVIKAKQEYILKITISNKNNKGTFWKYTNKVNSKNKIYYNSIILKLHCLKWR